MHEAVGYAASLLVGFGLGAATETYRYKLDRRAAQHDRRQSRTRDAIDDAYTPAYQIVTEMIRTYPNHQEDQMQLKQLLQNRASYFELPILEGLWVTGTKHATVHDLLLVQSQLRDSLTSLELTLTE